MSGAHHGEVATVEGGDLGDGESFGGGHDRSVDRAQRQVPVAGNQLCHAEPVGCDDGLDRERAGGQVPEEANLRTCPESGCEEVDHLGDDERRDDEGPCVGLEEVERGRVMRIVGVNVGVERPGVDDDRRYCPTSVARISSIRSETSRRPLRPAAAAPSRRLVEGPPR